MSIDVTNKVWLNGPQDAKQCLLLMAIADNANHKGEAWPGVDLLAQKSRQSVRNALRGILKLEREGWIVVLRRRSGDRARGNEYLINMARLAGEKEVAMQVELEAETGNLSRHDTVSLRGAVRDASKEVCASPSDTVSCGEKGAESAVHEVTKTGHQVTKRTSRGDKTAPCIENRQKNQEPVQVHPPTPQGGPEAKGTEAEAEQRSLWELANRIRARERQKPIAWDEWHADWRRREQSALLPAEMRMREPPRRMRPSRNSRASVGVFRGG